MIPEELIAPQWNALGIGILVGTVVQELFPLKNNYFINKMIHTYIKQPNLIRDSIILF